MQPPPGLAGVIRVVQFQIPDGGVQARFQLDRTIDQRASQRRPDRRAGRVVVAVDEFVRIHPGEFYGQRVTVSGRVTRVVGSNALVLGERVLVAGAGNKMLSAALKMGDMVQ